MPKFFCKLVGTTFYPYSKQLKEGDKLILVREPFNSFDKNAVAVYCEVHKVGYLNRKVASYMKGSVKKYKVTIVNIIKKEHKGVNLEVRW